MAMSFRSMVSALVLGIFQLGNLAYGDSPTRLYLNAAKLTAEEATVLEERLDREPDDLVSRSKLVAYYFRKGWAPGQSAQAKRMNHVLWLVRNAPEAGILGIPEGQLMSRDSPQAYAEGREA